MSVRSARYRVVSAQGEISGQAYIDTKEMAKRKFDTSKGGNNTYGGYDKNNLSLKTGELIVGQRGAACIKNAQLGYSSMNAFNYSPFLSDEAIMRAHKFIGVVKTDEELEENNYGQLPGSEGAAVLLAGSYTIANNGPTQIGAGDILAWQIPPSKLSQAMFDINRKGDRPYQGGSMGTPYSKALIEVVKFDAADFSTQLWGVASTFDVPYARGGVSDVTDADLKSGKLSTLQEEAQLWKKGLKKLAESFNVDTNAWLSADGRATAPYNALLKRTFETKDGAIQTLCQAITGAWYAKTSRIIGKAMSGGKPGASIDAMFGLFKVGF
jgi:hypothetical protein